MASDSGASTTSLAIPTPTSQPVFKPKAAETGGKALPPGGNATPATGASAATTGAAASAVNVDTTGAAVISRTKSPPPPPPPPAANATAPRDLQVLVDQLNKYLNDSGRPNQYRVDTAGGARVIQEINPANGRVIGQFSADEFPALARGLGVSGLLFNGVA